MKLEETKNVGVVGAGLMGHGIAQVFGSKGYRVNLFDKDQGMLESAPNRIRKNLQVFLEMKLTKESDVEQCLQNINLCYDMSAVCSGADIMIEAVIENLEVKKSVFAEMERLTSQQTILCSNTSGISIGRISEGLQFRDRVIGTHFWNPPHVVPCVEVIKSEFTSEEVFHTIVDLMKELGKEPVRVLKDILGFLGNRLQLALFREALSLVEKGIAAPEDIDRVVKYSFGSRLPFIGPFETADLAGIDLGYEVYKYLVPDLSIDSRPSNVLKTMIDDGLLGVKTGKGFYRWSDEKIKDVTNRRDSGLLELIKIRSKL
ncbi:MAG: 3-hydroxyacyl-CoA dehydrogenase family protein [Desulfobacterales bacterium]|nr:3-hydroxyacyl-CoA dehydrogenase family protein [Desulfobacterales bacterium]